MNPDNQACNTEYAFAHFYQPHPYLYQQSGVTIQPIQPTVQARIELETPILSEEPIAHEYDPVYQTQTVAKKARGRPKKGIKLKDRNC